MLRTDSFSCWWICAAGFALILTVCAPAFALTGSGDSQVGLLDTTGPQISGLQFDQSSASPGETVTLTFVVSEVVDGIPFVSINGHGATFVSQSGSTYTYSFGVFPGGGGPTPAYVHISASDALGNTGTLDDSSSFVLNFPALPAPVWVLTVIMLALGAIVTLRLRRSIKISLFMLLFAAQAAHGQPPEVSKVHFVQQPKPSGGTEVVITYDLVSELCNCNIEVSLSKDAGADGFPFPVTSISGDIAHVSPGTGKRIIWDVAADYPSEQIPQAQLRVTAVTRPDDLTPWKNNPTAYIFANEAQCQNHLKQVAISVYQFARFYSQDEYFPKLSSVPGRLMFTEEDLDPECLLLPKNLDCPGRADRLPPSPFDDTHYVYFGYLLQNEADFVAFGDAYHAEVARGGDFSGNLPGTTSYGNAFYRLRDDIENVISSEPPYAVAQRIPIMMDWPDNHQAGWGGTVLYLDGHVEFKHYPDEFPMTEAVISMLAELADYVPPTEWNKPDFSDPYPVSKDPYRLVSACRNQCRQIGHDLRHFAVTVTGDRFPKLSSIPGLLMIAESEVYPQHWDNPEVLVCPGAAKSGTVTRFDDQHFVYLGYLMLNDDDVDSFVDAYADEIADGGDFSGDLPAATSYGNSLLRLRRDIGDRFITNPNDPSGCIPDEEIPILIEWPENHEGLLGGSVVYLDGHSDWVKYPGKFPMTERTVSALRGLAGQTPTSQYALPNPASLVENDKYRFVQKCRGNIGTLSLLAETYQDESTEYLYPRLSNVPGRLMMEETDLYPEYLTSNAHICPGPEPVMPEPDFGDSNYVYFGYAMTNDADVTAFAQAYANELASGGDFSGDLPATTSYGNAFHRLDSRGPGSFMLEFDSTPEGFVGDYRIPVLMEWPGQHEGLTGGHVWYLDGHAEFVEYPGKFPMTESAVATLDSVATWNRTTAWAQKSYWPEHDPHLQYLCEYNMRIMNIAFKTYAGKFRLYYPPLSNVSETLIFESDEIVPYHLADDTRLNCPASPYACATPAVDDQSYAYLGYLLLNDSDVAAFATAHAAVVGAGGDFSDDLPGITSYGSEFVRLSEWIGYDFNSPVPANIFQRDVPVLIEWPDNHDDLRGGNVMYMDGHIEWIAYPGKFPMTVATMNILSNLAGRPPIQ